MSRCACLTPGNSIDDLCPLCQVAQQITDDAMDEGAYAVANGLRQQLFQSTQEPH